MLTGLLVFVLVILLFWIGQRLGIKDKGMDDAYGKGAMVLLDQTLRELGFDPVTAIYSVYRDPVLMTDPKGVLVVGMAEHAAGDKRGFVFEVIPGEKIVDGTMISASLSSGHKERAMVARINKHPLVWQLRTDEETGLYAPASSTSPAAAPSHATASAGVRDYVKEIEDLEDRKMSLAREADDGEITFAEFTRGTIEIDREIRKLEARLRNAARH
jgi:hypothetical protein